ncbi:MAG: hypothetical protein ACRAUR_09440 [Acinetobacter tandoii]
MIVQIGLHERQEQVLGHVEKKHCPIFDDYPISLEYPIILNTANFEGLK